MQASDAYDQPELLPAKGKLLRIHLFPLPNEKSDNKPVCSFHGLSILGYPEVDSRSRTQALLHF